MCGIFAYLNHNVPRERRYILEVLLNGLRRLEYRGYDSGGIAIDATAADPKPPIVFRDVGNIDSFVRYVYEGADSIDLDMEESFTMHAGIAHNRWATHGEIAPRNSHPQSSGEGHEFLVVHNGMLINFEVLKETLKRHGFTFESDTDTEVIPKLAKYVFDQAEEDGQNLTFSEVVGEVMRHLEGSFALIFKSSHYPNELVACRCGSPLLLGVNQISGDKSYAKSFHETKFLSNNNLPKEYFFSSDPNALIEHTNKVLLLEDNEVVHLKDGEVSILKYDSNKTNGRGGLQRTSFVERALSILKMEAE